MVNFAMFPVQGNPPNSPAVEHSAIFEATGRAIYRSGFPGIAQKYASQFLRPYLFTFDWARRKTCTFYRKYISRGVFAGRISLIFHWLSPAMIHIYSSRVVKICVTLFVTPLSSGSCAACQLSRLGPPTLFLIYLTAELHAFAKNSPVRCHVIIICL